MSSPGEAPAGDTASREIDVDAEMEDATTQDAPARQEENVDHDMTTQTETQQPGATATTASGLPHHNRKDVTLREFLSKMDDYAPIIPDAVTAHYLTLSGLPPPSPSDPTGASTNTTPLPLARLLALATQKFVADIAADAYQYSRIRSSNNALSGSGPGMGIGGGGASSFGAAGAAGGSGGAGAGAGGAGGKNQQNTTLGVQRSGYGGGGQGGSAQGKTVLTMEDLGMAVQEYGINVKRGEFYR
ncbi:uncharacterized protein Z520_02769 [Fonsecaea multimorphosa CBS 102226]|uniref:Transcription initiation factor TFIID subunit 10 n=1 Tax=Fonsecaea multimorphosa CBS 102226 TaxID=1442371 RepID=A0A0D2IVY6_9EURO|nr:uncharacterized protein Z520_02769 [Fonsecaea multimorphosa CBS 102226]KIY01217.1 hypothetical protein Z520_02769 [Fonsecaea multimorphosa CBS 102226]OAL28828.1 hypothetical protein AYO22_02693 [Fonsecaea multimorphosa]